MKILKVVLVAALVSFAMLSIAQINDVDRPIFESKYISIANVRSLSPLDYAIRMQVDPTPFLVDHNKNGFFIANIKVESRSYRVRGTYEQWRSFFNKKGKLIPSETIVKNKGKIE